MPSHDVAVFEAREDVVGVTDGHLLGLLLLQRRRRRRTASAVNEKRLMRDNDSGQSLTGWISSQRNLPVSGDSFQWKIVLDWSAMHLTRAASERVSSQIIDSKLFPKVVKAQGALSLPHRMSKKKH